MTSRSRVSSVPCRTDRTPLACLTSDSSQPAHTLRACRLHRAHRPSKAHFGPFALLAAVFLASLLSLPVDAAYNAVVDYVMPVHQRQLEIPCSKLVSCFVGASLTTTKVPDHGTVEVTPSGWLYTPNSSFWSVGTDSFGVPVGLTGSTTIQIVAGRYQDSLQFFDFEHPSSGLPAGGIIGYISRMATTQAAALHGNYGLQISLDDPEDVGLSILIDPSGSGGYPTGSSAIIVIDICSAIADDLVDSATMLRATDPFGVPLYELRYGPSGQRLWAVAFVDGVEAWTSEVVSLGPGAHKIDFDWWAASNSGLDDGGFMFLVDDMLEGRVDNLDNSGDTFLGFGVGSFAASTGISGIYHVDDIWIGAGSLGPRAQTLVRDGFENDLGLWASTYDPTQQLALSTTGAVTGTSSLAFQLKGNQPAWIQSDDPSGQRSFGVRFSIDSSPLYTRTSGEAVSAALLGVRNSMADTNHLILRGRFSGQAKSYELQLIVRENDGTWVTHPWVPLDFRPYSVEVQFLGALDATSNDGVARLWIDGQVVGQITNLDNHTKRMGTMRLGVFNRNGDLGGNLRLDNFESWGG